MDGLVSDVETNGSRSGLESRTYHKRDTVSIAVITEIRNKIKRWLVDVDRIIDTDIEEISSTTTSVKQLRAEIQGGNNLDAESLSFVKKTIVQNTRLIGQLVLKNDKEELQLTLKTKEATVVTIKESIMVIQTTMTSLQQASSESSNSGDSLSSSSSVITSIISVMQRIISSGLGAITSSVSASLVTYQEELQLLLTQVTSGSVTFSIADIDLITQAVMKIGEGSQAIEAAQARIEDEKAGTSQLTLINSLLSATLIVKEQIDLFFAAMNSISSGTSTVSVTISQNVINLLISLQTSAESVTEAQIFELKAFETEASTILSNDAFVITNIQELISANDKLSMIVNSKREELSSRSSISETVDVIKEASYFISSIKSTVENIQSITQSSSSTVTNSDITATLAFLSELKIESLTTEDVTKLASFYDKINSISSSADSSVGYNGLDSLLEQATSLDGTVLERKEKYESKEQTVLKIERFEKINTFLNFAQTRSMTLRKQFSSASSTTASSSLRDSIDSLVIIIKKFSSKTYEPNDEDILLANDVLNTFESEVSLVISIKPIATLEKLITVSQTAIQINTERLATIQQSYESKQELEILASADLTLINIYSAITTLKSGIAVGATLKSSVFIEMLQTELSRWNQSIDNLGLSSLTVMTGLFKSLSDLSGSYSGLDDALLSITSIQESLSSQVIATEQLETASDTTVRITEASNIISSYTTLLKELSQLSSGGTIISESSEVTDIVALVVSLSTNAAAISAEDLLDMREKQAMLEAFVASFDITSMIQISNLDAAITEVESVEHIFQQEVQKIEVTSSSLDLFQNVLTVINEINSYLEELVSVNSALGEEAEGVQYSMIDSYAEFITLLLTKKSSITREDLQNLYIFRDSISSIVADVDGKSVISGFTYTIQFVFQQVDILIVEVGDVIVEEQNQLNDAESLTYGQDLTFILSRISAAFERMETFSVISSAEFSTDDFTIIMNQITTDITSVTSFQLFDIEFFVVQLEAMVASDQKLENFEQLVDITAQAVNAADVFVSEAQVDLQITINIRHTTSVQLLVDSLLTQSTTALGSLQPSQLIGERNTDVELLILFFKRVSVNIDSVTEVEISEVLDAFDRIQRTLNNLGENEGIGNLIDCLSAAQEASTSASVRLEEQLDRSLIKIEIVSLQLAFDIIYEISIEIDGIISAIGSTTSVGEENSDVLFIISVIESFSVSSLSDVYIEQLNGTIQILEMIKASISSGVEIPGILTLQELVQSSMTLIQTEIQFLEISQEGRLQLDLLSEAVVTISSIQEEFLGFLNFFSGSISFVNAGIPRFILEFGDLLTSIFYKEFTFDINNAIASFLEEMPSIYEEEDLNLEELASVLEKVTSLQTKIERDLKNAQRISEIRGVISTLNKANAIFTDMDAIFSNFTSIIGNAELEIENAVFTAIIEVLFEIKMNAAISQQQATRLEELLRSLQNVTVQAGIGIIGLDRYNILIKEVRDIVAIEMSYASILSERIVKSTALSKEISLLNRMTLAVSELTIGNELATTEDENEVVNDLIVFVKILPSNSLTMEEIAILQEKTEMLEAISVTTGNRIAGLSTLKSAILTRLEESKKNAGVYSSLVEVNESKERLDRTESVILSIQSILFNLSTDIEQNDFEPDVKMIELRDILMTDVLTISNEVIIRIEEIYLNMELIGAVFIGSSSFAREILHRISVITSQISVEKIRLQLRSERIEQAEIMLQAQSLFAGIEKVASNLTAEVGGDTAESEANVIIQSFEELLFQLSFNVFSITQENILFLEEVLKELRLILNNKSNVKGIMSIIEKIKFVSSKISLEIEVFIIGNNRELQRTINLQAKESVIESVILFNELSELLDGTEEFEIEILEVEKCLSILLKIEKGLATKADLSIFGIYLHSLESRIEILEPGMTVKNLEKVFMLSLQLIDILDRRIIEGSFDIHYTEIVFKQKTIYTFVSKTLLMLEEMRDTGRGIPIEFLERLFTLAEQANSRSDSGYLNSFKIAVEDLMVISVNGTGSSDVIFMLQLGNLVQEMRSSQFSLSMSISRSYTIETIGAELFYLEQGRVLLLELETLSKDIGQIVDPSGLTLDVLALGEMILVLQNATDFGTVEITLLEDYVDILHILKDEVTGFYIEELDELLAILNYQVSQVSRKLREDRHEQMKMKQLLYTHAAEVFVSGAYFDISSYSSSFLGEIEELEEATRFSLMLNTVDITTITPTELHRIEMRFRNLLEALSFRTSRIAYISRIVDQLALLNYEASRFLAIQESFGNAQVTLDAFDASREATALASSALFDLGESIGAVTTYEINSEIEQLYYYLLSFTFDWRLLPKDFSEVLGSFNISTISASSGTGIVYLDESIQLLDLYTLVDIQTTETISATEYIIDIREIQSAVSFIGNTVEEFLFGYMYEEEETIIGEDEDNESEENDSNESKEDNSKESGESIEDDSKESKEDNSKESKEDNSKESKEDNSKESKEDNSKESKEDNSKESVEDNSKESKEDNSKESVEDNSKESKEDNSKESKENNSKEDDSKESKENNSKEDNSKESKENNSKEDNSKESKENNSKEDNSKESKENNSKESKENNSKESKENNSKEDNSKESKESIENNSKESKEDKSKESKEDNSKEDKSKESKEDKSKEDKSKESKEDKSKESIEDDSKESKEDKSKESKEDKSKESKEDKSKESKEDNSKESKEDKSKESIEDDSKESKEDNSKESKEDDSKESKEDNSKESKEDDSKESGEEDSDESEEDEDEIDDNEESEDEFGNDDTDDNAKPYISAFYNIIHIIETWSEHSIKFKGPDAKIIINFAAALRKRTIKHFLHKIERQSLIRFLTDLKSVLAKITAHTQALESSVAFQASYSKLSDLDDILISLKDSLNIISQNGGKVTAEARDLHDAIMISLESFTDVHSLNNIDLYILRSYSFELRRWIVTGTGDIDIDVTKFSVALDMVMHTVEMALLIQSPFNIRTESVDIKMPSALEDLKQVSQRDYVLEEMEILLHLIFKDVEKLHEDRKEEDYGPLINSQDILNDLNVLIRVVQIDVEHIQMDHLTSLAEAKKDFSLLFNRTVANFTVLEDIEILITHTIDKINRTREDISLYVEQSNVVMTTLELSSFVGDITRKLSLSNCNNTEERNTFSETDMADFEIITNSLISFSLMPSKHITRENFHKFKIAFQRVEAICLVEEFPVWYYFLFESKITLDHVLLNSLDNRIFDSFNPKEHFKFTRAVDVIYKLTQLIEVFKESLDGSTEFNSILSDRLKKIAGDAKGMVSQWSMGVVKMYQLSEYESIIAELSEMSSLLVSSDPIPELNELSYVLLNAQHSLAAALERSETYIVEDMEFEFVRTQHQFFMQFRNILVLRDPLLLNVTDNATVSEEVRFLLTTLEMGHVNLLDNDIEIIQSNVSNLIVNQLNANQTVSEYYSELATVVGDIANSLDTRLREKIWSQMISRASSMFHLTLPCGLPIERFVVLEAVDSIDLMVKRIKNNLYTLSRYDIIDLPSKTTMLAWFVQEYGLGIAGLSTIRDNLANIITTSQRYTRNTKMHYTYKRALRILQASEHAVQNAMFSLHSIVMGIGEITEADYTNETSVVDAYNILLDITSDIQLLPYNLNEVLKRFNFSAISFVAGTGIQYIAEVINLMEDLEDIEDSVKRTLNFLEESDTIIPIRDAVASTFESLQKRAVQLIELDFDSDSNNSSNTTTVVLSTTPVTTNVPTSTINYSAEEEMDILEVIKGIMNITDSANNIQLLSDVEINKLMSYLEFLRYYSKEKSVEIPDLLAVSYRLNNILDRLRLNTQATEIAIEISESYNIFKRLRRINGLLHSTLSDTQYQTSTDADELLDKIAHCYEMFSKGIAFISKDLVSECRMHIYMLSASNKGNAILDYGDLQLYMDQVNDLVNEHYEFISVLNNVISEIPEPYPSDLLIASHISYNSKILEELLDSIAQNISSLIDNETIVNVKSFVEFSVLEELSTALYSLMSMGIYENEIINSIALISDTVITVSQNGSSLNTEKLTHILNLIKDFSDHTRPFDSYADAANRFFVLLDSYYFVEEVSSQTGEWANIIDGIKDEGYNMTASSTFGSTSVPATSTVSSSPDSTMVPLNDSLIMDDEQLLHMKFMEGSDIMMKWTFDKQSINIKSLGKFKRLVQDIREIFRPFEGQEVSGFHIWRYSLLEYNSTLPKRLEQLSNEARELASFSGFQLKYSIASDYLHRYIEVLEDMRHFEGSMFDHAENGNNDNSNQGIGQDSGFRERENSEHLEQRLLSIGASISFILEKWETHFDRKWLEIGSVQSKILGLKELNMVEDGSLHPEIGDHLKIMAMGGFNVTLETLDSLSEYAQDACNVSTFTTNIKFFQQLRQFMEYSIGVIEVANNTFNIQMPNTTTTTNTTTTVTSSTSNAISISTIIDTTTNASLFMNETFENNVTKDLLSSIESLLVALRLAQNGSASEEDVTATSTVPSTAVTSLTSESMSSNSSNTEDDEVEHCAFEFEFEVIRGRVYYLWRGIAKEEFTGEFMFNEAVALLEEGITIAEDFIRNLTYEKESIGFLNFEHFIASLNQTLSMWNM